MVAGVAVSCGVVELQLLGGIADAAVYVKMAALRRLSVEVLETTEADFRRAMEVQAVLAEQGQFGVGWAPLVVAAVAERYRYVLLHCERQFELIGQIMGQSVEWVA
jgi:predicted nucleic acid-binding protein